MKPKATRERGIALISVLWGAVMIAALAGSFVYTTRADTRAAYNMMRAAQAKALADGGVFLAIDRLRATRNNRAILYNGVTLTETIVAANGDASTINVVIQDEGGKIDLNGAAVPLIEQLVRAAGTDTETAKNIAAAIADWRDRDNDRRDGGAEASDYRAAGREGQPANAPFAATDELRHVLGMTEELLEKLRPAITVHARRYGVDPALLVPLAAAALALPPPGDTSTQDDNSTTAPHLSARRFFDISSRTSFSVEATGTTADGARFTRTAIVGIGDHLPNAFAIYAWR